MTAPIACPSRNNGADAIERVPAALWAGKPTQCAMLGSGFATSGILTWRLSRIVAPGVLFGNSGISSPRSRRNSTPPGPLDPTRRNLFPSTVRMFAPEAPNRRAVAAAIKFSACWASPGDEAMARRISDVAACRSCDAASWSRASARARSFSESAALSSLISSFRPSGLRLRLLRGASTLLAIRSPPLSCVGRVRAWSGFASGRKSVRLGRKACPSKPQSTLIDGAPNTQDNSQECVREFCTWPSMLYAADAGNSGNAADWSRGRVQHVSIS